MLVICCVLTRFCTLRIETRRGRDITKGQKTLINRLCHQNKCAQITQNCWNVLCLVVYNWQCCLKIEGNLLLLGKICIINRKRVVQSRTIVWLFMNTKKIVSSRLSSRQGWKGWQGWAKEAGFEGSNPVKKPQLNSRMKQASCQVRQSQSRAGPLKIERGCRFSYDSRFEILRKKKKSIYHVLRRIGQWKLRHTENQTSIKSYIKRLHHNLWYLEIDIGMMHFVRVALVQQEH